METLRKFETAVEEKDAVMSNLYTRYLLIY